MALPVTSKSVLLVGASRGLGLAMVEEYLRKGDSVVATVRGSVPDALTDLRARYPDSLQVEFVDITVPEQLVELHARLFGRTFDLLFINAGIANGLEDTISATSTEDFSRLMLTNALSPMRFVESFKDLVSPSGTIAVMSSGQGSIANNERGGFEIYRASKSALNQLMRSYAARTVDESRTLLLMAPGWVKDTGVGGSGGRLTIEESIPNLVGVIDAQAGHGGLQFLDYLGRTVVW